jgi:hypothetical protein
VDRDRRSGLAGAREARLAFACSRAKLRTLTRAGIRREFTRRARQR